ncbi:MAG TPA: NAD-dependent epimerase/dehydratase family protein [Oligoflexia bacterium]|nr:NAD-dependent epimerase/dehydratase family protein [Oligoflexia bacterium]HMP48844.1 NAD-dependent epimerase/dehydratase family protein [Oligoflexia bacterium]
MKSSDSNKSTSNNRVLVTGASGLIGEALCTLLAEEKIRFDTVTRLTRINKIKTQNNSLKKTETTSLKIKWPEEIESLDLKPYQCIVHLALPPVNQNMTEEKVFELHINPVQLLINQIQQSNPDCHLIFISSQSAITREPDNKIESRYGAMKLAIEKLLKNSKICFTIVTPGLVYGEINKGLFGAINKIMQISPIVPLIGPPGSPIQPVYLWDLAKALKEICLSPNKHTGKHYHLAGELISFDQFLFKFCSHSGRKRFFVRIPEKLLDFLLITLEKTLKNPPFTRTNLLGFLNLTPLSTNSSWAELSITPTPLEESIHEISLGRFPDFFKADQRTNVLAKECLYLFFSLFRKKPPQHIISNYINAHSKIQLSSEEEDKFLDYIVENRLDAEAIEFALRESNTALRKKLLLIVYLSEIDPSLFPRFVTTKSSKPDALGILFLELVSSAVKIIKGHLIIYLHPLLKNLKS